MHYEILDNKRISFLPRLKLFKDRFYLAGGTGLALQIGHRDSIDFDFFSEKSFDARKLYDEVREAFAGMKIEKTQEEKDTLSVVIDGDIRVSFFRYPYPLICRSVDEESLRIASIEDISCMKLSAIVGRSALKDYADLYFILKSRPLKGVLEDMNRKMPDLDRNLVLKSLVYFEDIVPEKLVFKGDNAVSFGEIKSFLVSAVKDTV